MPELIRVHSLRNHNGKPCEGSVVYADNGPALCRRRGRVMIAGKVYCLQHAGAIAIKHAIERGSL